MTKTEKIINELIRRGCTEIIPSKSSKYRQFKPKDSEMSFCNDGRFYWVGRNGAVRVGKNSSDSISITLKIS